MDFINQARRGSANKGQGAGQRGILLSFAIVGTIHYNCKTRQNASLTGQERQGYVQLKVS